MERPFAIRKEDDRIEVRLIGRLDEPEGAAILHGIKTALDGSSTLRVLIDLDEVSDSTLLGRAKLVELQQMLHRAGARTVWLSSRPRFRGLALVVCHSANDPNAKVLARKALADEWFESSTDRIRDASKPVDEGLRRIRKRRRSKVGP